MTKRAKRYSTRTASIALGTVLLGLLVWAILAFAAGTVTTDKSTYSLTKPIKASLAGGIANVPYRLEFWSPKYDNMNNVTSVMRCYTSANITSSAFGGATTVWSTSASNKQGTNWTARYAYNPNYKYPHYVAFDTGTTVFLGTNKQIIYRFHLVDRNGVIITQDHSADIRLTLYSSNVAKYGWTYVKPTTANGWTFTTANGQYSKRDTIYKRRSTTNARIMRLCVFGNGSTSFVLNGRTAEPGDTAVPTMAARYANHVIRIGAASTTAYPYKINPVYPLNTSPGSRNEIFVAGGTSSYTYNYTYDVLSGAAYSGGVPATLSSTASMTITATAYPMWSGGAAVQGGTTTYTGGHFVTPFTLTTPGKYAIFIRWVRGTNTASLWQIVNYVATSSYFTMNPAPTPPAEVGSLNVTPGDRKVDFSWTNPANPSPGTFGGVVIFRNDSYDQFPTLTDGATYTVGNAYGSGQQASTCVYNTASNQNEAKTWTDGTSCPPTFTLTNGSTHYYKIFTYDTLKSYSTGTATGGESPSDTVAPQPVTSTNVRPTDRKNYIRWTPSTDCDYRGVRVRASTSGYPVYLNDTTATPSRVVVDKTGYKGFSNESTVDNKLTNGVAQYYSIWAKDDDGNWSATAAHAGPMAPQDNIPPGQITNLSVAQTGAFTARLTWTAPADSGYDPDSGNASAYDLRYYDAPITDLNWDKAFKPGGSGLPQPVVGAAQEYTISGLAPMQTYYFAIKARDEVNNWSVLSNSPSGLTLCNQELTGCEQCHQMPPTDGLPGEHPRSTGNIGSHYLPIHTGGGNAKQCNVCHANGQVYDEATNTLIYQYNHQSDKIDMNYSGMIGNLAERTSRTGGSFQPVTLIVHRNEHTGYSTAVGYKQLSGRCVNTYCHGAFKGASASPMWGMETISCGEYCHEAPPATGKHVKHYHPGVNYINFAPTSYQLVSGYTNDDGSSGWTGTTRTQDNGNDPDANGNTDPRYATYIASSNATKTISGLSSNTTYYVTVCVGDAAGPVTGQSVWVSGDDGTTWVKIIDDFDTTALRLYKKISDYPVLIENGHTNLLVKIGNGSVETKMEFMIVNPSPEAPKSNNTVLSNTPSEYGFQCGKCHTSDDTQTRHTTHVGGPYASDRAAEIAFDARSKPMNPLGVFTTAAYTNISSFIDGQGFHYTTGNQCQNLYCHGNTLNAGGSATTPTWRNGFVDEQGSSLCGSCHDATYKDTTPLTCITTGSHKPHVANVEPYRFDCYKCHSGSVKKRTADGTVVIDDRTVHVNGTVDVIFDPHDPTMSLGHYSAIATPKFGYCIEVYCHSNGLLDAANQPFGATKYAMPQWSVSKNVPCDFCHGQGSNDGTPLYLTSATTFNSHQTHVRTNGIRCNTCHYKSVDFDGQTIIQKNNTTVHVNGEADVNFNYSTVKMSGVADPAYNNITRQCANTYCHGNSVQPKWGESAVACGDCHGMPPQYGRHDVHSQGNYDNIDNSNANKSTGNNYDYDCRFCHYQYSHGKGAVSSIQAAEVNFNTVAVQDGYNNTGGTYTAGSTGNLDNAGWSYTDGSCSVKCHSDGKGGPPNVTNYTWNDGVGSLGCFGCHGGVVGETPEISTGRHDAHINNAPYFFACDTCHYDTATGNSVTHAEKHVNGTVDVVIKGGGTWSGSTCSGAYCHSNGNPGFDRGSANYFATSPVWSGGQMDCMTCHSNNHYDAGDGVRTAGQTLSYNHQRHLDNYTASYAGYGSRIGCATCHNKTASSNTDIQPTGTAHVNFAKDVVFWTASTAGTAARMPFKNMTGPDTADPSEFAYWGAVDSSVAGADLSCTVLCHSDGRGNPPNKMPNWSTAQGTYGCGSCHGYAVSGFNNITSGSHKKHVAGSSNYPCGACHRLTAGGAFGAAYINRSGFLAHHVDGIAEVDMALSIGGTYDSGTKTCSGTVCHGAGATPAWGTGTTTCASCHASPPRNAQHFGHYSSATLVTTNNTVNGSTASLYQFGCGKCHLTPPATHAQGMVKSNQSGEVYFDAGTNPMNTYGSYTTENFLLYSSQGGMYRESKGLCRNLYCHSDGKATPAYAFINWSTPGASVTCTACHGGADTVENVTLSSPHMDHIGTDFYNLGCQRCHKTTVSGNSTISNKAKHVNGVRDVSFYNAFGAITGFYVSASNTCRNTYCHSDGNGGWKGSPTWTQGQGTLACTGCHNASAGSGQLITTGKHGPHVNRSNGPVIDNMPIFGCIWCHVKTVSDDSTLNPATLANHVNGTKDVYFKPFNSATGFYMAAGKTCRSSYCHSSGQAAPTFRVTSSWTSATYAAKCYTCHGCDAEPKGINGAPNYANVSTADMNSFNSHLVPGHVSSKGDCIHCHMHTVDSFGNLTTGETQHINGTREVVFQLGGTYDPVNKRCTDTVCHGATSVRWGGMALNCVNCHSDMGAGASSTQHYYTGKHQKHTEPTTYRYACEICHATKNASGNISHATGNVSTDQAGEVTFQTSTSVWRNMTYKNVTAFRFIRMNYLPGTATLTNIEYQPGAYQAGADNPDTLNTSLRWTNGRCTNVWCHSNGQATPTYNTYQIWSSAQTMTCTSCHGDKTSDTLSGKHQQHVNNGYRGDFGCVQCHKLTVSSDSVISSYGNHVNGKRDVSFSTLNGYTGFYTASQTCRNNYCHSSGQGASVTDSTPVFRTPSWTGSALGCNGCHGTGNAYGTPDYSNVSTVSRAKFNSHGVHVASGKDCIKCHMHTVDSFGNLTTGTTQHIDGTRNVSFQLGGIYDPTLKTCQTTDSTDCHGGITVVWGNWRGGAVNCGTCHLTAAGGADVDDFYYGNGTKSQIAYNEWTGVGHGKMGNYLYSGKPGAANAVSQARKVTGCMSCHDSSYAHNNYTSLSMGNFFRLKGGGDPNVLCTTAVGCHTTGSTGHHNAANILGDSTWVFTPKCIDCHEPHGDMGPNGRHNNYMIQKLVNYTTASATSGVPAGTSLANPNPLDVRKPMSFPANATQPAILDWSSYVSSDFTGLCQVCHTRGAGSSTGASPGFYSRNLYDTTHNPGSLCTDCHSHDVGFKGAGSCTGCHGTGGMGTGVAKRRDMQKEFSNSSSHHINTTSWSSITTTDCSACHAEGDYATGTTTSWHRGVGGWPVYLKKWTSAVSGSGTFDVISTSRPGDANATVTSQLNYDSSRITPFCLGCHSDQNNNTAPFSDGKTPRNFAWDYNSVDSRYSNLSTTPWGKFNSTLYNVVPADIVTKAFSPHGNAGKNDSVMSVASFATYSSTKPVACYDCHNAHASNVGGGTTYTSGTGGAYTGGIFNSYTTAGGEIKSRTANSRYQPRKSGSTSTKNEAASSSTLCFDCHYGDATDAPKKYTDYGLPAGKSIAGNYYDRVGSMASTRWDNWSTSRWANTDIWRGSFAYKDAAFRGGHFGKGSNWLQITNGGTKVNDGQGGKCVKCHDPHGTSPATKRGYTKPVRTVYAGSGSDPVLSGTFSGAVNNSAIVVVRIGTTGGAYGTATYQVSTDGGRTWGSSTNTNTATTVNGVTITFPNAAGSYNTDDTWTFMSGANPNYMVPALKGTWMTSPYKEDRAPRTDHSVAGGRLAAVPRANDFLTYSAIMGNRRFSDRAQGTAWMGRPAPRAAPDFEAGTYLPGYNIPAVQGGGFGQGPISNYGWRAFASITGMNGWNGYFIDDNTFGYWKTTYSKTGGTKVSNGTTMRNMTTVNAAATPGNFAGLCLQCHAWQKNSGIALKNTTSGTLGTGPFRQTTYPHNTVLGLGLANATRTNLMRRAENYTTVSGTVTWGTPTTASNSTGREYPIYIHGINATGTSDSQTPSGYGGTGVSGPVMVATDATGSFSIGAGDGTASTAMNVAKYYRWAMGTGQRTVNTVQIYHRFPCSKCHTPHVSRLPRLMKTNCLDNDAINTFGGSYASNTQTTDTTRTKLWGAMFRNMACHSTKIGAVNKGSKGTAQHYQPGGWNNETPW